MWRVKFSTAFLSFACFFGLGLPAAAQSGPIEFSVTVPKAPAQMEVYKLAPSKPPIEFLNQKLEAMKVSPLKLEQKTYLARTPEGQEDRDRVRAYADPTSGDAHLIPSFAELVRQNRQVKPMAVENQQRLARSEFARFLPKDMTEVRVTEPITISGGATQHGGEKNQATEERSEERVVMTMAPADRYAGRFPCLRTRLARGSFLSPMTTRS